MTIKNDDTRFLLLASTEFYLTKLTLPLQTDFFEEEVIFLGKPSFIDLTLTVLVKDLPLRYL